MLSYVNRDPSCLQLDYISGYILNVPSDYRLGFVLLPLKRRHWVAVRQVDGTYYNFDSKLETPLLIGQVCYAILLHCLHLWLRINLNLTLPLLLLNKIVFGSIQYILHMEFLFIVFLGRIKTLNNNVTFKCFVSIS